MELIIEAGSTKIHWALVDHQAQSMLLSGTGHGLNPMVQPLKDIVGHLYQDLTPELKEHISDIQSITYYGAGSSREEGMARMKEALATALSINTIPIDIFSDLLGAARAGLGSGEGLVGILGTGTNLGYYDGRALHNPIPSLGYLAGDEGAGYHLGKLFLKYWAVGALPTGLAGHFAAHTGGIEKVLSAMYHEGAPNKYLASLTMLMWDYRGEPVIEQIIQESIADFMRWWVTPLQALYPEVQSISVVGSMAQLLKEPLKDNLSERGLVLQQILASPIHALVDYHLRQTISTTTSATSN